MAASTVPLATTSAKSGSVATSQPTVPPCVTRVHSNTPVAVGSKLATAHGNTGSGSNAAGSPWGPGSVGCWVAIARFYPVDRRVTPERGLTAGQTGVRG